MPYGVVGNVIGNRNALDISKNNAPLIRVSNTVSSNGPSYIGKVSTDRLIFCKRKVQRKYMLLLRAKCNAEKRFISQSDYLHICRTCLVAQTFSALRPLAVALYHLPCEKWSNGLHPSGLCHQRQLQIRCYE